MPVRLYKHCKKGNTMDCKEKMRELRALTGMNRRVFCETLQIPYQTVTDWELGHRRAPEYVMRLLEYYIRLEYVEKTKDKAK